jgi:hypothetical protein
VAMLTSDVAETLVPLFKVMEHLRINIFINIELQCVSHVKSNFRSLFDADSSRPVEAMQFIFYMEMEINET